MTKPNTINNIVTVKDLKGNVIVSAKSYAQYFVRDNNTDNNTNTDNTEKPGNSNSTNGGTSVTVNNNNNNNSNNNSNGTKLVYTGNDFSVVTKTILAVVAMASIGMVVKKYAK